MSSGQEPKTSEGALAANELLNVRGHVYRVAGFNAYGQAMLEEIAWPTDAERIRALTTVDLLRRV